MADFNKPDSTSLKIDVLSELKARATDIATGSKPTNPPANYISWNANTNLWERWTGTVWTALSTLYAITVTAAQKWSTARTITLSDHASGNVSIDGSANVTLPVTVRSASTTQTGVVQLNDTLTSTSNAQALTAAQGKTLQDTKLNSSAYTAADVLAKIITVDGAGSNLDADLLDGQQGSWYAPKDSPAFTGTPTTTTATTGDNSTRIASTAYVNAEIANAAPTKTGGGASGTWGISITGNAATANALASDAYVTRLNATGTGNTFSEAGIELLGSGTIKPVLGFNKIGEYTGTLQQVDVSTFKFTKGDNSLANLAVLPASLPSHAVNFSQFDKSLAANGWQKLPSGFILQWGSGYIAANATVTFPIAFPNACLHANWVFEVSGLGNIPRVVNRTNTSFQMAMDACCVNDQNPQHKSWFAIGY